MIERHKKPGGFRKLVNMLEVTPTDRKAKILDTLRKEDAEFVAEVEKHLFSFEEFKTLNDMLITDIVFGLKDDIPTLALALYKCKDQELLNKFVKNMLPAQGGPFRDEIGMLDKVTVGQQKGAQFRVIQKAREMERAGNFVLKKYSPNYIDDD